jgi:hypothetical protein
MKHAESRAVCYIYFLLDLIFDPEDGGDMFLQTRQTELSIIILYPPFLRHRPSFTATEPKGKIIVL